MPLDPYARIFRPDFQATQELPEWVPMGENEGADAAGQATGSFVDMLKKRMAGGGKPTDLGGGSTFTPGGTGATRPRMVGGGGGEGGGGQSL
jgi:hypothetical protein